MPYYHRPSKKSKLTTFTQSGYEYYMLHIDLTLSINSIDVSDNFKPIIYFLYKNSFGPVKLKKKKNYNPLFFILADRALIFSPNSFN